MNINNRVKVLREKLDITQTAFGARINMQRAAISRIEKGERNITDRVIADIVRVFNVSEAWLRHGEGEMFAQPSDNTLLEQLRIEYDLSGLDLAIIEQYLMLSPRSKAVFKAMVRNLNSYVDNHPELTPYEATSDAYKEADAVTPLEIHEDDEESEYIETPSLKLLPIPLIGRVAGGFPLMIEGGYDEEVYLNEDDWEEELVALVVEGDSMEPKYPNGSYIIVKPTDSVNIGDLVIAIRDSEDTGDGEATFKCLASKNGRLVLRSLNDRYPDQKWDSASSRIYGKVVGTPDEPNWA